MRPLPRHRVPGSSWMRSKDLSHVCILRREPCVDIRLVHLVRDSRGVAYSWTRPHRRPEATHRIAPDDGHGRACPLGPTVERVERVLAGDSANGRAIRERAVRKPDPRTSGSTTGDRGSSRLGPALGRRREDHARWVDPTLGAASRVREPDAVQPATPAAPVGRRVAVSDAASPARGRDRTYLAPAPGIRLRTLAPRPRRCRRQLARRSHSSGRSRVGHSAHGEAVEGSTASPLTASGAKNRSDGPRTRLGPVTEGLDKFLATSQDPRLTE